jgi:hypothetical protein
VKQKAAYEALEYGAPFIEHRASKLPAGYGSDWARIRSARPNCSKSGNQREGSEKKSYRHVCSILDESDWTGPSILW